MVYTLTAGRSSGAVGAALRAALQFFTASQLLLTEPWPEQAKVHNESHFDFIIIGGGTAGATLAARLCDMTNMQILLIEAGADPPQESIIPGFRGSMKGSQYDWNFTTMDDGYSSQALTDGSQKQPRGKMLGGTGSINDMVYARGFPADYDEWATIAGKEWNWDNVLEYFKKTEHMTDENIINDPEFMKLHGRDGEIEVSGSIDTSFETEMFIKSFSELGYEIVSDMTYPNKIGVGRFSHTIRDGRRDSSLTSLLNQAAKRDNLHVLKDTLVTKILTENQTASGVEVLYQNEYLRFYVTKEVIVSAGTFNTPKLLLLSGIGPKEHLQNVGIEVIQDLPVGENLHDHVMVLNYIAAENGTCFIDQSTYYMDVIRYFYDHSGLLSLSNSMGAYLSLNDLQPNVPDFAFYPSCVPIGSNFYESCLNVLGFKNSICAKLARINEDQEIISIAVVLLKPKSRGVVQIKSNDPFDDPLIISGTFNDVADLENYPDAIKVVHSLINTSYFSEKRASVIDFDIDECHGVKEEVKCKARAMAMSAWHSVGTAAMGSVVDSELRVKGVSGLRVVDASVMPQVIRGNTNAPVVMIAEKAAEFIKK